MDDFALIESSDLVKVGPISQQILIRNYCWNNFKHRWSPIMIMAAEHSTRTIEEVGDLDTTFLQTILKSAPISSFNTTRIGTGQVGEVYRIYLTYSSDPTSATPGPATAILKIASKDPRSRSSGLSLGIYERENRFYGEIVPSITANEPKYSTQCIPQCYYSVFDPSTGALTLILQDAGPDVEVGDEFKGASFQQAQVALRELGHLHAALLMDPGQREWLIQEDPLTGAYLRQLFAGFKFRYKDRVEPEHMEICDRFVASFDAYMEAVKEPGACNMGVIHGTQLSYPYALKLLFQQHFRFSFQAPERVY